MPAIQLIRDKFPQARITVLAQPYTAPLLQGQPAVDRVIFDYDLKKYRFDLSVNYYNQFRDTWATLRAGIPRRLGDSSRILTGWMNNLRVFRHWEDPRLHELDLNLELLRPLGISGPLPDPIIKIDSAASRKIDSLLAEKTLTGAAFLVGVHVGSKTSAAWDAAGFAELVDWLQLERSAKVVLLGGPAETEKAGLINTKLKSSSVNFAGVLDLPLLIALISRLNFYVGMDTGPSHIAAAFKIPMVMLCLNKNAKPERWGPRHANSAALADVSAGSVIAACARILKAAG